MNERDRLNFIQERDGQEACDKFAEQTFALYVAAAVRSSPYKDSIEEIMKYLKERGFEVTFCGVKKDG